MQPRDSKFSEGRVCVGVCAGVCVVVHVYVRVTVCGVMSVFMFSKLFFSSHLIQSLS